ncbi:MAG: tRNA (adenosine(37)-N6)-threonylcarbamoyltransferase complex transferase subunit TsaD [Actinomycetota bacterium]|nr:tRNA (adenosine(37)-N6)-threonylcarbamoyltransferase complex transferase subunit TsaD [Actinomycetota bacterium]
MTTVLGIETSCDETGIGIVRDGELLGQALASSMAEHARFGGVVPEIAARAHLEALPAVLQAALDDADRTLADVGAVAVTAGPGLASALHVGVAAAKALCLATGVPLYAVHHAAGHVAADLLEHGPLPRRCVALIVSGGHTSLVQVDDLARDPIVHLGDTLDDAAGEAFDKVARLLELPYPGGPSVDAAARSGDPDAIRFPRALTNRKGEQRFSFSFSGLKTAIARHVEALAHPLDTRTVADVAASFQEAVVDSLVTKSLAACAHVGARTLLVVGGVAANRRLSEVAAARCAEAGVGLRVPRPALCTDNGAMIAAVGDLLVRAGRPASPLEVGADPSAPLTQAALA